MEPVGGPSGNCRTPIAHPMGDNITVPVPEQDPHSYHQWGKRSACLAKPVSAMGLRSHTVGALLVKSLPQSCHNHTPGRTFTERDTSERVWTL